MTTRTTGASAPHPSVFTARESAMIYKAMSLIEAKCLRAAPILYYFEDFQTYLLLRFAGLVHEEFHVLYLNFDRRLLAAERAAIGDQKSVSPDFRQIAHRALSLGADSIVVAHNHPTGNPTPSEADVSQLNWSEKALAWLNITLLDSYVVSVDGITSIRQYRDQKQEIQRQQRYEEQERASAQRRAKLAATRAAKRAAQPSQENHHD